jgi:hypothetical protein
MYLQAAALLSLEPRTAVRGTILVYVARLTRQSPGLKRTSSRGSPP